MKQRAPEDFLYDRRGPWPQPSPHAGWELAPAVLNLPSEEQEDFDVNVGRRIGRQVYLDPVLRARSWWRARRKLEPVSLSEFIALLTTGAFSRFLNPTLDPWDRETFAEVLATVPPEDGPVFKVDFRAMVEIEPFPGMYVAPTVTLLQRREEQFHAVAIAIGRADGDRHGPGATWRYTILRPVDPTWELAQYFVLQGAANHLILMVHPRLHFPMDAINAVSKTVLPRDHLLLRLLLPHTRFTLPLDKGVLERDDVVLGEREAAPHGILLDALRDRNEARRDLLLLAGLRDAVPRTATVLLQEVLERREDDDTDDLRAPFVASKDHLLRLIAIGYAGLPGNSSYPAYAYPTPPPPVHSVYGEYLERYYAVIEGFVREVLGYLHIDLRGSNAAEAALAVSRGWLEPDQAEPLRRRADEEGRRVVELLHGYPLAPEDFAALHLEGASQRQVELAVSRGWLTGERAADLRMQARLAGRSLGEVAVQLNALDPGRGAWLARLDDDAELVRRWAEYLRPWIRAFPEGQPNLLEEIARGRRGPPGRDYLAELVARYMWDVSVAHAADHWSLVYQLSLGKAPLRLRVPPPSGREHPGGALDRDALVTRGDMARTWFANEVFFKPVTVTRLYEVDYPFGQLPLERQLREANRALQERLRDVAAAIPAGAFIPLEEISASIQY